MNQPLKTLIRLCALLAGWIIAGAAFAISNVEVTATGPQAGSTTIRLFDSGGKQATPDAGNPSRFRNLQTGTYSGETLVGGKQVGGRSTVRLEDGDNQLRVDSTTGAIEVIRRLARMQQQQQDGFGMWVFGGWKRTPFDGSLTSNALGGNSGSTDLETDAGNFTWEGRYRFPTLTQLPAVRLFAFGGYTEYFGADREKLYQDRHPTPGNDSGIAVDEKYSWTTGLGAQWMLTSKIGMEGIVGAHWTRTEVAALSNESCCGGPNNRFTREQTKSGLMLGLGFNYQLSTFASGRPIMAMARYTGMKMDDIDVTGISPAFGFDYRARVNGGWNHSVQVGIGF